MIESLIKFFLFIYFALKRVERAPVAFEKDEQFKKELPAGNLKPWGSLRFPWHRLFKKVTRPRESFATRRVLIYSKLSLH
ncbi:MAG TPA: hypothetical protein DD412_01745 [Holosporales bacterium]|nr:hypothetical protein [Holosporales bacterium]